MRLVITLLSVIVFNLSGKNQSIVELQKLLKHVKYESFVVPHNFTTDSCPKEDFVFPEGLVIPPQYRCQFGLAFKYYPELRDVKIEFQFKHVSTTLQAQPVISSLFRSEVRYKIIVNNNPDFEGILFDSIPFNGQVGIIAHELAHILDYKYKTRFGIVATGLKYLFKGYKRRYEKAIDYLVIQKGLGWQLHDWAQYAMYDSRATSEYKTFKMDFYLEPDEVKSIIGKPRE
ncbi:MAG: hypothetical protein KIS94_04995 [Chitinophagales bacterium]|nr:hypothetical protein [Chitinophagales bacterium]